MTDASWQLRWTEVPRPDELHTYRGRQGADVALCTTSPGAARSEHQCVGTSATMASEGSSRIEPVVARVASKLFSIDIPESNVIVETLDRVTDSALDKRLRRR